MTRQDLFGHICREGSRDSRMAFKEFNNRVDYISGMVSALFSKNGSPMSVADITKAIRVTDDRRNRSIVRLVASEMYGAGEVMVVNRGGVPKAEATRWRTTWTAGIDERRPRN